jgi:hypothetical protein
MKRWSCRGMNPVIRKEPMSCVALGVSAAVVSLVSTLVASMSKRVGRAAEQASPNAGPKPGHNLDPDVPRARRTVLASYAGSALQAIHIWNTEDKENFFSL